MAPTTLLVIVLSLAISLQGILGTNINCDMLDEKSCAFAVSFSGRRCVLESRLRLSGTTEYACRTSEIVADKITNWVETDSCISACGLDRRALGISSDSLLDGRFAQSLCSEVCYNNCPNIVDLYFNLAAGEGVFLPRFCGVRQMGERRELVESAGIKSSYNRPNFAALGPTAEVGSENEIGSDANVPSPSPCGCPED
ncbi:PAR1 protein [Striga hermonthica]|uniref:PAR1 protein n=1 Tax=Striga hermonthica TaxID=68872 RepID=A0A9N7N1Y5_STRHE|nr:PAR1 protein [Striga hermonthica]